MELYENIERLRWKNHMSKTDLCKRVGISYESYRLIQRGGGMKVTTLMDFARALKVQPATLLKGVK